MKARKHNTLTRMLAIPGAVVLAGLTTAVHADPARYEMVVLENSRYARSIMSRDYERTVEAVSQLEGIGLKSFHTYNNLCVAYTMTRAFDQAKVACDEALAAHDAHSSDAAPTRILAGSVSEDRREAIALTNRGVLKAVVGDLAGARDDFTAAADLSSAVKAASVNMKLLSASIGESSAIARVER